MDADVDADGSFVWRPT